MQRLWLLLNSDESLVFCRNVTGMRNITFLRFIYEQNLNLGKGIIMDSYIQEKIHKFEEFVDGHLKPQLVRAIAERDKVFEQQKIFSDLRRNIENLEKNSVTNLRTLVNLGSEVYMQADVPDTQSIFVDVGLGFHVEFTWTEALNFIALREEKIARQIEEYTRLISSIKARIKLVCEGIRELLQLPAEKALPQRVF
uniref:C-myc binding family protein n=2 Tax=Populus alba TaxID=43335 RepID=A0A4U5Q480_POPAL|nr:c-myc binding family protein [Populus alba]